MEARGLKALASEEPVLLGRAATPAGKPPSTLPTLIDMLQRTPMHSLQPAFKRWLAPTLGFEPPHKSTPCSSCTLKRVKAAIDPVPSQAWRLEGLW